MVRFGAGGRLPGGDPLVLAYNAGRIGVTGVATNWGGRREGEGGREAGPAEWYARRTSCMPCSAMSTLRFSWSSTTRCSLRLMYSSSISPSPSNPFGTCIHPNKSLHCLKQPRDEEEDEGGRLVPLWPWSWRRDRRPRSGRQRGWRRSGCQRGSGRR